jgi:hypothetical protein
LLKFTVKDPDPTKVGRAFANRAIEMALAHYPGFYTGGPPSDGTEYAVYWPALVPSELIEQTVHFEGATVAVPAVTASSTPVVVSPPRGNEQTTKPALAPRSRLVRAPLGRVAGARSGDKGGNANVGLWVRTGVAYSWLLETLTPDRLRRLLPEARGLEVERHPLPNLLAVNFVIRGLLGDGVAASTRADPQAKGLGEYLRAKVLDIPEELLPPLGAA